VQEANTTSLVSHPLNRRTCWRRFFTTAPDVLVGQASGGESADGIKDPTGREVLLALYDVPAERWYVRNPPIRANRCSLLLRLRPTEGNGSRPDCLTIWLQKVEATRRTEHHRQHHPRREVRRRNQRRQSRRQESSPRTESFG